MLKVLSNILCDLDPKVKVIGQKAGICDGVPSTSALVLPLGYLRQWLLSSMAPAFIVAQNKLISYSKDSYYKDCWARLHMYLHLTKI